MLLHSYSEDSSGFYSAVVVERRKRHFFPKKHFCMVPSTREYDAHSYIKSSTPSDVLGNWRLFEDRHGKPGWIATEVGQKIVFNVTFGQTPSLAISYMRSYSLFGSAEFRLNGNSYTIDGHWEDNLSIIQTLWLQTGLKFDQKSEIGTGAPFDVKPGQYYELEFTFIGSTY